MIEIDFIGYNGTHSEDFVYGLPQGHDSYLLLLTSTPAAFCIEGEMQEYPAHSAILYTPGSQVLYRACGETYMNDWIRFHSDEAFVEQLPIKNMPFTVNDVEYCHNLFMLLTWEASYSSANSDLILSHLLRTLFLKLHESCTDQEGLSHSQAIIDLHKRIYNNPQLPWSVSRMAEELHLSTGYLQLLYKKMFGSSCMDDVITERLRRAKNQLIGSSKSIRDIAEECGYNNIEHFCRQFHRYIGCSPSQYRKASKIDMGTAAPIHATVSGEASPFR
ncbi:MAG: AraC family transcriptional regulator [Roseburia sp.]|nr:AraC family transcriptional regulator [Roseburia sp.]